MNDLRTEKALIDHAGLDALIRALKAQEYLVLGPTLRDRAIVYEEVDSVRDLPAGWTDEQEGGVYRVKERDDRALFGYANSPQSWKRYLHPPVLTLFRTKHAGHSVELDALTQARKYAFLGVRSCELHAIAIQDRVFLNGPHVDAEYKARREQAFIIAVNCGTAGGTCFCVSMKTGPKATFGYDLAMTELLEGGEHRFLVETGSEKGAAILAQLPRREASSSDEQAAAAVVDNTAKHMGRSMRTDDVRELLQANLEHPRWDEVAQRCLSCGNCTQVCPTCFCSTVEDVSALDRTTTERVRRWDSCFTLDHSYIHGGSVRSTTKSRYRQWLTHKLSTWWDQFDTSGCVGCGRCITWCPVAIDITEEVRAIRENSSVIPAQAGTHREQQDGPPPTRG